LTQTAPYIRLHKHAQKHCRHNTDAQPNDEHQSEQQIFGRSHSKLVVYQGDDDESEHQTEQQMNSKRIQVNRYFFVA
jgi:hypothetical protein